MGTILLMILALSSALLLIIMVFLLRKGKEIPPDKWVVGVPRYRTGERTAPTVNRFNPWQRNTFGFGLYDGPLSARPE